MNKAELEALLKSLAEAWTRRDYKTAASFFAEDIHYSDPLRYTFSNRMQLQAFFEADEDYDQQTVWHTIIFDESIQTAAAEYTYEGTYRYHGVVLVRLKDNKIFRRREYQHIDDRDWEA